MTSTLDQHIGARVGNVTAIARATKYRVLCICDCGNQTNVQGATFLKAIREGRGVSCGCMKKALIGKGKTIHGLSDSPTMKSWASMLERCYDKGHKSYGDYGARGIEVCQSWRASFSNFLADMGVRPEGKTLGRIRNDEGYSASNCEWQTYKCQANNRRSNRVIEFKGQRRNLNEWADLLNIPSDTLAFRLRTWPIEEAFSKPLKVQKNNRQVREVADAAI